MMRRLAALLCLALPALAETPPALAPTRDITITYDAPAQWGGRPVRIAAGGRLIRSEVDDPELIRMAMIHDHAARKQTILLLDDRQYMIIPYPAGMPSEPDTQNTVFRRLGTRDIAGLRCTDWLMHPKDSTELRTTICLTDDGVTLRRESELGAPFLIVALQVEYGPIPPAAFEVPEDFNPVWTPGAAGERP